MKCGYNWIEKWMIASDDSNSCDIDISCNEQSNNINKQCGNTNLLFKSMGYHRHFFAIVFFSFFFEIQARK